MILPEITTALLLEILFYLLTGFAFVTLIQLSYFWGVFSSFAFFRRKPVENKKRPVSVVICARNEYLNLKKNLPQILEQEYPEFEVVVVNDASDDDTEFLLKTLSEQYPHLSVIHFRENRNFFTGKKFPLALGIRSAKHEIVILTDADCRPNSPFWIREMENAYHENTAIVLAYSRYDARKGIFDKLLRFDAMYLAMKYFSYALIGMPYMGIGKNLSYKKALFYAQGGFISHYRIRFGDDDLFVNRTAKRSNTRIVVSPESQTVCASKYNFSRWIKKKKRQLATIHYYKKGHKWVLSLFSVSQFLFYLLFIILLCFNYNIPVLLSLFGIRMISALFIFKRSMMKLSERNLLLFLPLFEIFLVILTPLLSLSASVVKQDKWK